MLQQKLRWAPLVFAMIFVAGSSRAIPSFHSAAAARAWGEAQQHKGNDQAAAEAFTREADIRLATGDPQGADVELRRAQSLTTDIALAVPVPARTPEHLAKWEPAAGCYLGVQDGDGGSADRFADDTGRPLALAYEYNSYGQPFPQRWAEKQADQGRAIQIAWEPNDIDAVRDNAYLENWAEDAAQAHIPIFLRFGGEMNGAWTSWGRNPAVYRRAFRTVHAVMARVAPNVAMVWAPNAIPTENLAEYYPGDDAVDWVGISLYVVRYYDDDIHRPAWQDNPINLIEPIYKKYASKHPICLAEWGVSRRSRVEGTDADPFAAARIDDLFTAIKVRFPRLKMVCAFDRDNLTDARPGRRLNDYSMPAGSEALDAYRQVTTDPYFLTAVSQGGGAPYSYQQIAGSFPIGYSGAVVTSLEAPALFPMLDVSRPGMALRLTRPFSFDLTNGHGPLDLRVMGAGSHLLASEIVPISSPGLLSNR